MLRSLLLLPSIVLSVNIFAALAVSINEYWPAFCNYPSGQLYANISGGTPPYTIQWSNGANTPGIDGLMAGSYSVLVTDMDLTEVNASYTLVTTEPQINLFSLENCPDGLLGPQFRMVGQNPIVTAFSQEPFTIGTGNYLATQLTGTQTYENVLYVSPSNGVWPAAGTQLNLTYYDGSGCSGTLIGTVPESLPFPIPQLLAVDGACSGGNNGSAQVHMPINANASPYFIELYDGSNNGYLANQYNFGSMYGQIPITTTRNDLGSGDHALIVRPRYPDPYAWLQDLFFLSTYCADTTWFTVPDLGFTCGTISGTAYMDDNLNCLPLYNEARVPNTIMEIQPGNYFAMTDAAGIYQANLPYGSYTVEQQSPVVAEHCTGAPLAFDLNASTTNVSRNFPDTALFPRDVAIHMSSTPARPGFLMNYGISLDNTTIGSTGNITVTLTFDPLLSFVGSGLPGGVVVGNTVTWTTSQLTAFGTRHFTTTFQVPADVNLIGTDLLASASVSIVQSEINLANNTTSNTRTITGSYDPNAKESMPKDTYDLNVDNEIDYTIQFQNTGNDTAFFVVITDTLPETLDPSTFQMGVRSHPGTVEMLGHGVLRFIFSNILLPDSNTNEAASHGFVSFSILPRQPLLPGTMIENVANIYFDYNPPVITDPNILVAQISTGVQVHDHERLILKPNPASDNVLVSSKDGMITAVRIVAMDGREVLRTALTNTAGSIDVSTLSTGCYTVIGTMIDGATLSSRFLKL